MTDIHDDDLAEEIDRELDSPDSLIALVLCLSVTVGLAAAGVASLFGIF